MTVNQVYSIINSVTKQMYGESAITVTNLTGLIQLGDTVLNSADSSSKDKFLNTLVDRIGKTVISARPYSASVLSVLNDAFSYGAIMQKIYVEPIQAKQSPQWDLQDGASVDQYIIAKPKVRQKLFRDIVTWEVQLTIPDIQLKSAFTSMEEMTAFIDAIFLAMRNSMEVQLESMLEMTYCNFIGSRIVHTSLNGGRTVINLLADYNTVTGGNLTSDTALRDTEFLKYSTMIINLYLKRMNRMSVLYNSEGCKRFTSPDFARVTVLADFTASVTSFLQSDTYHAEMVSLPNYNEVPFWQGSGEQISFADTSKISIVTSDGYTVEQNGVIALITDVDALGITVDNRRSKSAYNNSGEYTNYWEKADMGYFNDLSENGIVFIIADSIVQPTMAMAKSKK